MTVPTLDRRTRNTVRRHLPAIAAPAGLTGEQQQALAAPLDPARVQRLRGQSHLEAWDVRRHLIRVFGFGGFDIETVALDLIRELEKPDTDKDGKPFSRWTVVYRAEARLIIKDPAGHEIARFEDGASGDAVNMPSLGDAHDFALKTALSQALKRCAVNLGDRFGLSLYDGGSTAPVVGRTLTMPTAAVPGPHEPQDAAVRPDPETIRAALHGLFTQAQIGGNTAKAGFIAATIGRSVESSTDLTPSEVEQVVKALHERIEAPS